MNTLPIKLPNGNVVDLDRLPHLLITEGDKISLKAFLSAALSAMRDKNIRVVSNPPTLKEIRSEMEQRLMQIFLTCNSSRIEVYNAKKQGELPYVIIILNDITDLLANDMDNLFAVLAKGRAPGYHIIAHIDKIESMQKFQDILLCFYVLTLH